MTRLEKPQQGHLSLRQRYGLYQALVFANFGAVPTVTARSLISRQLVVPLDSRRPRGYVQLTTAGWSLLSEDERRASLVRAYEAARAIEAAEAES